MKQQIKICLKAKTKENSIPKPRRFSKSRYQSEICTINACIKKKCLNKQLNIIPEGTRKEESQLKFSRGGDDKENQK